MKNYYNFTKANLKDTNYNLPTRQIFPFISREICKGWSKNYEVDVKLQFFAGESFTS